MVRPSAQSSHGDSRPQPKTRHQSQRVSANVDVPVRSEDDERLQKIRLGRLDSAHLSAKSKVQKQREFESCVKRHTRQNHVTEAVGAMTRPRGLRNAHAAQGARKDTGSHKLHKEKRDKRPSSSD